MIAKKLFVIGYLLIEILIIVHQNSLDGHFANWKTTFNTIHETKFNLKKKTFKLHFFFYGIRMPTDHHFALYQILEYNNNQRNFGRKLDNRCE